MKSALALLALTTAITTSVVGALSATPMSVPGGTSLSTAEPSGSVLLLADNDEKGGWRLLFGDDDDHHAGHDSDDDEGGNCAPGQQDCVPAVNPAPAGDVAPPANGLFNEGAAPTVQVN
jgi:hypothetical protein